MRRRVHQGISIPWPIIWQFWVNKSSTYMSFPSLECKISQEIWSPRWGRQLCRKFVTPAIKRITETLALSTCNSFLDQEGGTLCWCTSKHNSISNSTESKEQGQKVPVINPGNCSTLTKINIIFARQNQVQWHTQTWSKYCINLINEQDLSFQLQKYKLPRQQLVSKTESVPI